MNTLILIRHAQSDQHVRDITGGWTDTHLTDLGRQQSERIARRVEKILDARPAKLFSSDLSRAAETSRVIADICHLQLTFYEDLRELNNGSAINLTRTQAKAIEQPITEPIHDWIPYPKGESWKMMADRVYGFMELVHPLVRDTAIIVTHGNAGVAIIQWWLGLTVPCVPAISFEIDPASITILAINFWNERTIRKLNDTAHLHGLSHDELKLLPHQSRPDLR
jgi:broad specificity phosphatase PhoE